jgi:uncharacterized protein YodC (DUF2158 family)
MKLKIGDVVQLPSGGPPMTVGFLDGDNAGCVWFVDGKVEQHKFRADALVVIKKTDADLSSTLTPGTSAP